MSLDVLALLTAIIVIILSIVIFLCGYNFCNKTSCMSDHIIVLSSTFYLKEEKCFGCIDNVSKDDKFLFMRKCKSSQRGDKHLCESSLSYSSFYLPPCPFSIPYTLDRLEKKLLSKEQAITKYWMISLLGSHLPNDLLSEIKKLFLQGVNPKRDYLPEHQAYKN